MIEHYLKDLMAIPHLRIDNSDLLVGLDCVSSSITDCINLVETSLRNIFSGLDQIDSKIIECIKLAEDTLRRGSFSNQKEVRSETHKEPERCSPRFDRTCHTSFGSKEVAFADSSCKQIILDFLDPDHDQAFIDYLNILDCPDSFDDLDEWSDDIDLFMKGLSNPDKIKEL